MRTRPRNSAYSTIRPLLAAGALLAPIAGLWLWAATELGDALVGGMLAGLAMLGALTFVPQRHR